MIIIECPKTLKMLELNYKNDSKIKYEYMEGMKDDKSGPSVLARLRTYAIYEIGEGWFSFLDDDNEFYPTHIAELYKFAVAGTGYFVPSLLFYGSSVFFFVNSLLVIL